MRPFSVLVATCLVHTTVLGLTVRRLPTRTLWRDISPLFSTTEVKATSSDSNLPPPPTFYGKTILPYKVLSAGLATQTVPIAAVYLVLSNQYVKGSDEYSPTAQYVGVTLDLKSSLANHVQTHGADQVAHVRPLSFDPPNMPSMQEVASTWREEITAGGGSLQDWQEDATSYLLDEDDDDDDDDEDEFEFVEEMLNAEDSSVKVSPFQDTSNSPTTTTPEGVPLLELNAVNVDTVLNEVRPYLIADGGNVAVQSVDADSRVIALQLEGACGSCASSTLTMQMGIERVLKEHFGQVTVQEVNSTAPPTVLTREVVEEELGRLSGAVVAMGGVVRLVDLDTKTGVVTIFYKGPDRVRQGLELAVRDVELVTDVVFTDEAS